MHTVFILFSLSLFHMYSSPQPLGWSVCQSPATSWVCLQGFNCSIPSWDCSKAVTCKFTCCSRRFVPGWSAGLHPWPEALVWGHERKLSQLLALFGELPLSKIHSMCREPWSRHASGSALCYLNIATFGGSVLFSPRHSRGIIRPKGAVPPAPVDGNFYYN